MNTLASSVKEELKEHCGSLTVILVCATSPSGGQTEVVLLLHFAISLAISGIIREGLRKEKVGQTSNIR